MNKILKYYKYFVEDPTGCLSLLVSLIRRDVVQLFFMPLNIWLLLKGCKIKSFAKFYGLALVVRHPNSQIKLGNNCIFISWTYGNYRGINHKCILNTDKEHAIIQIGDNCGFSGCSIVANKSVYIGNNVIVGANTMIGDRDDHADIYQSDPQEVVIEDNVWIGMNCIILKGVTIGKNSIIGAGSVVTKNIPANSIAAGVPCKVIKQRINEDK